MHLNIDPEFKALIPPLSPEEYNELRDSIDTEGCRDALVVWNNIIIDGHNRYEICDELNMGFDVVERDFKTREDAMLWMITNQFARRNLNNYVRATLVNKAKPMIAEKAKAQQGRRTDIRQNSDESSPISTKHKLSELAQVSHDTIHKVETVEDKAPEIVKKKAQSGEISVNRAYLITKELEKLPLHYRENCAGLCEDDPQKIKLLCQLYSAKWSVENGVFEYIDRDGGFYIAPDFGVWCDIQSSSCKDIEHELDTLKKYYSRISIIAKRESLQVERVTKYPGPGWSGVICGDMREVGKQIPDNSIDMIFTDPPYAGEYIGLFSELSILAERVLKPGGVCMSYSGQLYLPEVMQRMGEYLDYVWTCAVKHGGGNQRIFKAKVYAGWKPVLFFAKPPVTTYWETFTDIISGSREKDAHIWQQSENEASHFIKAVCPKDGTVLDPFAGGGTSLVAAKKLGLNYIGIEIDYEQSLIALERIELDS